MAKEKLNNSKGSQLEIPLDSENDLLSLSISDSERQTAKQQAIQRYLDSADKETIACVNAYTPGSTKRKYFRLSYRAGKRMKHIHIRGGSTIAELAIYRAKKLEEMIARGAELEEVIAACKTYNSGSKRTTDQK